MHCFASSFWNTASRFPLQRHRRKTLLHDPRQLNPKTWQSGRARGSVCFVVYSAAEKMFLPYVGRAVAATANPGTCPQPNGTGTRSTEVDRRTRKESTVKRDDFFH